MGLLEPTLFALLNLVCRPFSTSSLPGAVKLLACGFVCPMCGPVTHNDARSLPFNGATFQLSKNFLRVKKTLLSVAFVVVLTRTGAETQGPRAGRDEAEKLPSDQGEHERRKKSRQGEKTAIGPSRVFGCTI